MEVRRGSGAAGRFPSYLALVMRSRRPLAQLVLLVAVGAAPLVACGTDSDGSAVQPVERSWAPLPAEVPMPAAVPDATAAYRGVRYRPGGQTPGVRCCEARAEGTPWLRVFPGSAVDAGGAGGPFFGYEQVADGRRRMVWFFRLAEPLSPLPSRPAILFLRLPRFGSRSGRSSTWLPWPVNRSRDSGAAVAPTPWSSSPTTAGCSTAPTAESNRSTRMTPDAKTDGRGDVPWLCTGMMSGVPSTAEMFWRVKVSLGPRSRSDPVYALASAIALPMNCRLSFGGPPARTGRANVTS